MKTDLKNIINIGIINLLCVFAFPQNNKDIEKFKEIVCTLADDSMLGRAAGSEGEEKAKNYITGCFKKLGLTPVTNSYIQEFTFPKDSIHIDTAYNLIGYIDNKADSTIIIGAHYDHLGMGGSKSRSLTSNKIHNGADDNASGVAMMLLLAKFFSLTSGKLCGGFNYLFIAFSAHEAGLYGSEAFISGKIVDLSKTKLMLNFDMVGRLDAAHAILKVLRSEKETYLDSLLSSTIDKNIQLHIAESSLSRTDASAFTINNIPAITFSTGTHDDYHKVSDDAEKINYEGMNILFSFTKSLLLRFEEHKKIERRKE